MVRTAAEPILLGGGDPAREADIEADTTEAVSLIISLPGVSGRCEIETALEATDCTGDGKVGASVVLGVDMTRNVLGPLR